MRLDPNDPDVRMAAFGKQVEDFMASDIGQYLESRADNQIMEALAKLRTVDASKPDEVRRLQMDVAIPERILVWLREAIQQGQEAYRNLIEEVPHG